jgi:hypothetical protein
VAGADVTPAECEGVDPMGRGRAKAKQTKVARDLKYRSHETDLSALARELHGDSGSPSSSDGAEGTDGVDDDAVDEYDGWSDYSDTRSSRD